MLRYFILLLVASTLLLHSVNAGAQIAPDRYRIQFSDKNNSPFSVDKPEEFLSARAIERRQRQGIAVTQRDFPVNPAYVQAVRNTGDVEVRHKSRWFNSVVVFTTDTPALDAIAQLPFVSGVQKQPSPAGPHTAQKELSLHKSAAPVVLDSVDFPEYGTSFGQIRMLNMQWLHRFWYNGTGLQIAVMDAGFIGVQSLPGFAHLRSEGRILATHDFVDGDADVYHSSTHGMQVLSTMAAVIPYELIGTAPGAAYYLLRTEATGSEYRIEEDNFAAAAEFADSAGADIINVSLGYTIFDDPAQDYTYNDMDGNTTRITRAADLACARGMLVVASAGNHGNGSWYYLAAPSDGDSVLAVGSVNADLQTSSFSSRGPAADGRVKPDVAAQGGGVYVANNVGGAAPSTGTSFSGPLIAGSAAALWQAAPELTAMQLRQAIVQSAHQYLNPDSEQGYGIPDFFAAWLAVTSQSAGDVLQDSVWVYPNPFGNQLFVDVYAPQGGMVTIDLIDITGKRVYWQQPNLSVGRNRLNVVTPNRLASGVYFLRVRYDNGTLITQKVVRAHR